MIRFASVSSAALALLLWHSASSLPFGRELRYASAVAAFGSVLLMASSFRSRLPRAENIASIPKKNGAAFVGRGYEWRVEDAEAVLRNAPKERAAADLHLPLSQLEQHVLILGTTGTGKTRLLELLILQAIARGEPVAILDPKGDERLFEISRSAARKAGRPFRPFLLPFPERSIRYNPVGEYLHVREVADRVAAILPSQGEAQTFRNYGWEVVDTVSRALEAAGEEITFEKLRRFAVDEPPALVRLLRERERKGEAYSAMDALARRPREHYQKMVSALVPMLSRLTACPHFAPGWSWEKGAEGREVAYFFLGSMIGYETANAVAKMALLDFQSFVGRRYAERRPAPYSLFVDELADVLTPEFVNILNKARGAGVRVTACAQTVSDFEAALGSRARALQVVGNVNTVIQFRAAGSADAETFAELAGRRLLRLPNEGEVYEPLLFAPRDVDDFRAAFSKQQDLVERPLVPPVSIQELPTFHYFGRWGARVYRGFVPMVNHEVVADLDAAAGDRGDGAPDLAGAV